MADVARLAGVSQQTVSRVLNDSPHVRAATRERVEDAVRKLGYRPNRVARALVTGRSRTLGVVSFDTTLFGPASTLSGIERAAHDAGYSVSIASLAELTVAAVHRAIDRLRDQGVDGVLVIAPQEAAARALHRLPPGLPVVATEAGTQDDVPLVAVDQRAGAEAVTRPPARARAPHGLARLRAAGLARGPGPRARLARDARSRAGAACPPCLEGDWSARSGYALAPRPARRRRPPSSSPTTRWRSACCAHCTSSAAACPSDVSVAGFDDIPEAAYFTPPLTTVRQHFDEVGRQALLGAAGPARRRARGPGARTTIAPELIVRASTMAGRT